LISETAQETGYFDRDSLRIVATSREKKQVRTHAAHLVIRPDPALAQEPPPFQDFTFKKVTPPKKGERPKFPQIEPQPRRAASPAPEATPTTPPQSRYGWFWDSVSPGMDDMGPARLETVLNKLANPPQGQGVAAPRLSDMLTIARDQKTPLPAVQGRRG